MARERSPNRDKAFEMWKESNGNMKLKDIAATLGLQDSQIRKWKNQDKWDEQLKSNVTNSKSNVTNAKEPKKQKKKESKDEAIEIAELTEKQVLFVAEYLIDFNATRAAMAVGYSKKSAYSIGWENLRKPEIQEEIKRQKEILTSELGITSQRVLLEYLKIAFADITHYMDFGQKEVPVIGAFGPVMDKDNKPVTEMVNHVTFKESTEIDGTLISEVKQGKSGISIKMHDKMKALEVLTKYLDLLPDHHKRMIEDKRLEIEQEHLQIAKKKAKGDGDGEQAQNGLDQLSESLIKSATLIKGEQ